MLPIRSADWCIRERGTETSNFSLIGFDWRCSSPWSELMNDLKDLKDALPIVPEKKEAESLKEVDILKLSRRERKIQLIEESKKIFKERYYTEAEKKLIGEAVSRPFPKTAKCNPTPTMFLPDLVPNEKAEELARLLARLPELRRIHKELREKYFPRKKDEPVVGEVTVKAADLQKFMDETWLPRPKAEKFLLRARGDVKEALELFVKSALESDSEDDADWDLDTALL